MAEASLRAVDERAVRGASGLPVPASIMLAALAVAVVGQGAFYGPAQRVVALLLAAAAVGLWPAARQAPRPLVGACVLFGGWALGRALLDGNPGAALSTVALLAGALVVCACAACDADQRGQLLTGLVVLGVLVALSGWAGVAWRRSPWALKDQGLWRAATTITYANAAGGLLAAVTLVSLARAAVARRAAPILVAANCILLVGLGATLSRGGLVALVAGSVVLVKVLGPGVVARTALAPLAGAGVALAGLAPSMPAGSGPRPVLAVAALALGVLVAVGAARFGRRTVLLLALAGACALVVVDGEHLRAIARPRLTAASPDRIDETRAALRLARSRPVVGVGQGDARLEWVRPDGSLAIARYAHNEYLQVLAELGVVGLALLLGLLFTVGRLVRLGREVEPVPGAWAGVAAGLVALAVHGLLDFGWHVPAVPLTGALFVGLVAQTNRKEHQ